MIKFNIAKNEITPMFSFLLWLGGFDKQLKDLRNNRTSLKFSKADFLRFKTTYLAEGKIKSIREKLEATNGI